MGNEKGKPRKKKSSINGRSIIIVLIILAVAVGLAVGIISVSKDMLGIGKPDREVELSIPKGSSVVEISKMLEDNGVIHHRLMFLAYCKIRSSADGLQAGDYDINTSMSYDMITAALKKGNIKTEEVTITFYEGMSIREIANLLEKNKVCTASAFYDALDEDYSFDFLDMIPEDEKRFRKLEGYLFPDTYNFYVGEKPTSVIKKFLRNFEARVFPEVYDMIVQAGMTLDQAVTLAAIIQEEASGLDEMGKVSSVFHNRLNYPEMYPQLQSDVTIFYVEKDIKPFQSRTDQEMYDSYNTYKCRGLPIGPICSPGIAAIKAAVSPDDTPYHFFVTDIKGKYYYAIDAQTHYANVRKAESVK